eukprot:jgi/Hompol1/977/HPOL_000251-RA
MSQPENSAAVAGAAAVSGAGAGAAPTQAQQQGGMFSGLFGTLSRMAVIYFAVQYFTRPKDQGVNKDTVIMDNDGSQRIVQHQISNYKALWKLGTKTDLYVYLSEDATHLPSDSLIWSERAIAFGDWNDVREKELDIPCSPVRLDH